MTLQHFCPQHALMLRTPRSAYYLAETTRSAWSPTIMLLFLTRCTDTLSLLRYAVLDVLLSLLVRSARNWKRVKVDYFGFRSQACSKCKPRSPELLEYRADSSNGLTQIGLRMWISKFDCSNVSASDGVLQIVIVPNGR